MSFPVNNPPPRPRRYRLPACPVSRCRHGLWIAKTLSACRCNGDPAAVAVNHILARSRWPVCQADIEARAAAFYAQ